MEGKVCAARCAACFFQGRSTGTCDYIFIVDQRRPCPPGEGCTAFVPLDRKEEFMRKPNWDTEAGRKMWLAGKKDEEIADEFGISTGAVTSYRKKHWEPGMVPMMRGKGKPMPAEDKSGKDKKGSELEGMKKFDFERGLVVPTDMEAAPVDNEEPAVTPMGATDPLGGEPEAGERIATEPAAPRNDSDKNAGYTVPVPRLDEMDIMAAATEHLSGMKAVCTACAIQALWFWTGPADLLRAKKNIDWLLDHIEG